MNYELARTNMVESQIRPADVTDLRIQRAMSSLPREKFVPSARKPLAYIDNNLEGEAGRMLLAPRSLARLIQACNIKKEDVVLDLAPGAGYSTAVLASLASAVVGVETDEKLVKRGGKILDGLGIDNAAIIQGDIAQGCPSQAPFDVIFINGCIEFVPDTLVEQLADGGRIGAIVEDETGCHACVFFKHERISTTDGAQNQKHEYILDKLEVFDAFSPKLIEFCREDGFNFNFS